MRYFKINPIIIVAIVIVIVPFSNLLHYLLPVNNLFGKSAWVVVPTLVLVVIYFYKVVNTNIFPRITMPDFAMIIFVVVSLLIVLIRNAFYGEGISFISNRYIATSLIYLLLAIKLLDNNKALLFIALSIVAQGFLLSLGQVINFHFFPTFELASDDSGIIGFTTDGIQSRSRLFSASISANLILCAMFVMFTMYKTNLLAINYKTYWILNLIMIYAISLGGSRYPFLIALILIGLSLYYFEFLKSSLFLVTIFITILLIQNIIADFGFASTFRFDQDYGGRSDKFLLPIQLLGESIRNFIIGCSSYQIANSFSTSGVGISDNSYLALALSFGVPFAVAYFTTIFRIMRKRIFDIISILFVIYLGVGFGITNCIYWESWMCISMFSIVVISGLNQIKTDGSNNSCLDKLI